MAVKVQEDTYKQMYGSPCASWTKVVYGYRIDTIVIWKRGTILFMKCLAIPVTVSHLATSHCGMVPQALLLVEPCKHFV